MNSILSGPKGGPPRKSGVFRGLELKKKKLFEAKSKNNFTAMCNYNEKVNFFLSPPSIS